jgi:hypothetical protein
MSNNVPVPDLRDDRAKADPGRWQPQNHPRTENQHPAGGPFPGGVPAREYHDRYPLSSPSPEGHPTPTSERRIRTER